LLEHDDLPPDYGIRKFRSQLVSDQLVHFSALDMTHFHTEIDSGRRIG